MIIDNKNIMLGDWVSLFQGNCDGSPCNCKITSISDNEIGIEGCDEYDSALSVLLFPIRLTPEILKKNGFIIEDIEKDGCKICRYTLYQDNIMFSLKYARSVFQWTYPIDVRYVHELQHLLKFCGIKKQIEL